MGIFYISTDDRVSSEPATVGVSSQATEGMHVEKLLRVGMISLASIRTTSRRKSKQNINEIRMILWDYNGFHCDSSFLHNGF